VARLTAFVLAAAVLFIAVEISHGFIPNLNQFFAPGKSPLLQAVDWDSVAVQIPAKVDAVAGQRWFDAGKVGYALRDLPVAVTVFGPEPHEFGFSTPPASLLGKNVLILAMPGNVTDSYTKFAPYFRSLTPGPALTVMHQGAVLLVIPTFIGTDLLHVPAG
jgi:hypothetical protein